MINKVLKVLFIFSLIVAVIFLVTYCIKGFGYDNNFEKDIHKFSGVVDEVNATYIIVVPDEDEKISKSSDRIQVDTNDLDFHKGDRVTIKFKGEVKERYPAEVNVISIIKEDYSKNVKLYLTVIDSIMNEGEGINKGREYLAIDTDSFISHADEKSETSGYPNISDEDETKILNYCTKYSNDVRKNSFEELKQQGLYNEETMSLSGMVIYIDSIKEFTENKVRFTIVKYVSGTGALFGDYTLEYDDDNWNITNIEYAIS